MSSQHLIRLLLLHCFLFTFAFAQKPGLLQNGLSPFVKCRNVGIGDVKWTHGLWADKTAMCHDSMTPYLQTIYMNRALDNFKIAAGTQPGEFRGAWWLDGDFYKWMEALVMQWSETHNPAIDKHLDSIITILAKAQQLDGYLNTATQIGHGVGTFSFTIERPFTNKKKWESDRELEVYNMGHLFTLAALHYRVTGKKNLLQIALKAADNICEFYKEPCVEKAALIFNPPQIMGMVELYRTTGNKKYLNMANAFLDMMGKGRRSQTEARLPVREVQHAWGHAVIGTYLYCGMADVYAETGDTSLLHALERLWEDVAYRKMYITGGIGSYHDYVSYGDTITECFGEAYDLPNSTAYNETCANIANAMWNWRMLGITGYARYADVMEKVFYNSLLSSVAVDGHSYFYTNVLRWYGKDHKLLFNDAYQRWNLPRGGICCPSNTARTLAEMSNYAYSNGQHEVYVNLYGSNTLQTILPDGTAVSLIQETDYPWKGHIQIKLKKGGRFGINLRLPGWADSASVQVNGEPEQKLMNTGKYFLVNRNWKAGDVVVLELPMDAKMNKADLRVVADRNQVAISCGPIIYCLETEDVPNHLKLNELFTERKTYFRPVFQPQLLGGVSVLIGELYRADEQPDNLLYKPFNASSKVQAVPVKLVPYYTWNNRGIGEMAVWLPLLN